MPNKDDLDKIFKKYHEKVNMTLDELKEWKKNPLSREASLSRAPLDRNIRLLSKPKSKWTEKDIKDAKRTISFISRMRAVDSGDSVNDKTNLSKRDIALKNWAFDPFK